MLRHLENQIDIYLTGKIFYPSRRLEVIDLGKSVGVFHSVFHKVYCFERKYYEIITVLDKGLRRSDVRPLTHRFGIPREKLLYFLLYLIENHILLHAASDEENRYICRRRRQYNKECRLRFVTLILTSDCNLKCGYCALRHPDYLKTRRYRTMSPKLIRRVIDFMATVTRHNQTRQTLTFFGGEPLLKPDLIEYAVRYIKSLGMEGFGWKSPQLGVATNGMLLDHKSAALLKAYGIRAAVSIDTPHDNSDKRVRPTSFSRLCDKIHLLEKYDIPCNFLITITKLNIEVIPELLNWLSSRTRYKSVKFNYLLSDMVDQDSLYAGPPEYTPQLDAIYDACGALGFEDLITKRYSEFMSNDQFCYSLCPASGQQVVIEPGGMATPCPFAVRFPKYQVAFNDGFDVKNSKPFMHWKTCTPWHSETCSMGCNFFSVCGGRCPYQGLVLTGDICNAYQPGCVLNRYLLRRVLKKAALELRLEQQGKISAT